MVDEFTQMAITVHTVPSFFTHKTWSLYMQSCNAGELFRGACCHHRLITHNITTWLKTTNSLNTMAWGTIDGDKSVTCDALYTVLTSGVLHLDMEDLLIQHNYIYMNYEPLLAATSASITGIPNSLKTSQTVLFPVAMPPVTPTINILYWSAYVSSCVQCRPLALIYNYVSGSQLKAIQLLH